MPLVCLAARGLAVSLRRRQGVYVSRVGVGALLLRRARSASRPLQSWVPLVRIVARCLRRLRLRWCRVWVYRLRVSRYRWLSLVRRGRPCARGFAAFPMSVPFVGIARVTLGRCGFLGQQAGVSRSVAASLALLRPRRVRPSHPFSCANGWRRACVCARVLTRRSTSLPSVAGRCAIKPRSAG